jgi:hypothetical protein
MSADLWLRVETEQGKRAHMAKQRYGGGWWTLCGRYIECVATSPYKKLCVPCTRRARERGIEIQENP